MASFTFLLFLWPLLVSVNAYGDEGIPIRTPRELPSSLSSYQTSGTSGFDGLFSKIFEARKFLLNFSRERSFSEERLNVAVLDINHQDTAKILSINHSGKISSKYTESGTFVVDWGNTKCGVPQVISKPPGFVVLALHRMRSDGSSTTVYTPYSKYIDTPEIRNAGYQYIRQNILSAEQELRDRGVESLAYPGRLVADVAPLSLALRLALIEHMDPNRFTRESTEKLVNEILVTSGVNMSDSFGCSVSYAGARGLFQFMEGTYSTIRRKYVSANLMPDFHGGMNNHHNASKAALLLLDTDLAFLPEEKKRWMVNNPEHLFEYLAAMYNSGRPAKLISLHGDSWREHLPAETKKYLLELRGINRVLSSM